MGQGIAQVTAAAGFPTRVHDVAPERVSQALAAIGAQLEKLVAKGKLEPAARAATIERLSSAPDLKRACEGASVVIEAVPEDMALKCELLRVAMSVAAPDALIASNTSSLSITELGARIGAPERTIGLHFFNPPPVMELLEIVRGLGTSDASVERAPRLRARHRQDPDRGARHARLRDEPPRGHPRRGGHPDARVAASRAWSTSTAPWSSATATRWGRSS